MNEQQRLDRYKELLLSWNLKVNLIGPEATRNLDEHVEEALEAARLLRPEGEVLDFGSGGGLPAIPMAIATYPRTTFHLVEADQKKWAFLKFAARECELNCVIYGDRLQRLAPRLDQKLKFSLVTSRAVGRPGEWLSLLKPHLGELSRVALFQGPQEKIADGFEEIERYRLKRGDSNYLVVVRPSFHVEQHG